MQAPPGPVSSCSEPFEDEGLQAFLKQLASGSEFQGQGGPSLTAAHPPSKPESAGRPQCSLPPDQQTRTTGVGFARPVVQTRRTMTLGLQKTLLSSGVWQIPLTA